MTDLKELVKRAIQSAVPRHELVERRIRPESDYSWHEPSPRAGLTAALEVAAIAQRAAYEYVLALRGEGISWKKAAELLGIEWSSEYVQAERAYELVLGPEPEGSRGFSGRNLYWRCGGPAGCGNYITDRGPYDGYPSSCEDGHAEDCRRHADERKAFEREMEEREERWRVAAAAKEKLLGNDFALATVQRAEYVQSHGGRYLGWSTSETLAVALVLRDTAMMERMGFSTLKSAKERVFAGMRQRAWTPDTWIKKVRAAATGRLD